MNYEISTEVISKYLVDYIFKNKKYDDMLSMNYIENGFIDSMSVIKLVVEIENKFTIEIDEEDIMTTGFKTVNGLTDIIYKKISSKS